MAKHFGYYDNWKSAILLLGHVTNGMSGSKVTSILRSIASDVKVFYASIESLSAGIRATKWEAGDEPIMCITVMPKKETTSHAGEQCAGAGQSIAARIRRWFRFCR